MATEKTAAEAFGARLCELMRSKGIVSDTARSGVDVSALAHAAGTSYEMARRYAEGNAVPRAQTLERIAAWLGVAPSLLAWGNSEKSASISAEALEECITAVIEAQIKTGITLSAERAARLVSLLYLESLDGRSPGSATVERMLKAVS
jgi:transcriptional regulator with XRE-family HTH domain